MSGDSDKSIADYEAEAGFQDAMHRIQQIGEPQFSRAHLELQPGDVVSGYTITGVLTAGGMGLVYLAEDSGGKRAAIKTVRCDVGTHGEVVMRFRQEMRIISEIDCPYLPTVISTLSTARLHFIAMEYIEGVSLGHLLEAVGTLAVPDACELVRQSAIGIDVVHRHGIVHRDIKPSNLMLTTGETVRILDLGLAAFLDARLGDDLTSAGQVVGTRGYIAPEHMSGTYPVDERSDVYSLAATLFALLVGKPPAESNIGSEDGAAEISGRLRSTAEVTPELIDLIEANLHVTPSRRLHTASDLARALTPFAQGANVGALLEGSYKHESPKMEMPRNDDATVHPVRTRPPGTDKKPTKAHNVRRMALLLAVVCISGVALVLLPVFEPALRTLDISTDASSEIPEWIDSGGGEFDVYGRVVKVRNFELVTPAQVESLEQIPGLTGVLLDGAGLEPSSLALLPQRLQHLSLNSIGLSDDDMTFLGGKTITSLNVADNKLTDESATYLGQIRGLRSLSISRNAVGDAFCEELAAQLHTLETLEIGSTEITDASLTAFSQLSELKSLAITYTPVTDVGIEALANSDLKLNSLLLGRTSVSAKAIPQIAEMKSLHVLDLSYLDVDAADLAALEQLASLQILCLWGTPIGAEKTKLFSRLRALRQLSVTESFCADVQALRDALPNCRLVVDPG